MCVCVCVVSYMHWLMVQVFQRFVVDLSFHYTGLQPVAITLISGFIEYLHGADGSIISTRDPPEAVFEMVSSTDVYVSAYILSKLLHCSPPM